MAFDLYSVFRQIIFNVKHGLLFTPAHCTLTNKAVYTSPVSS